MPNCPTIVPGCSPAQTLLHRVVPGSSPSLNKIEKLIFILLKTNDIKLNQIKIEEPYAIVFVNFSFFFLKGPLPSIHHSSNKSPLASLSIAFPSTRNHSSLT